MSYIKINSISIKKYRSFDSEGIDISFPKYDYKNGKWKPVSVIWYNNSWKTNLIKSILFSLGQMRISDDTFDEKDFHRCDTSKNIDVSLDFETDFAEISNKSPNWFVISKENWEVNGNVKRSYYKVAKKLPIYYINFHEIKKELETKSSRWGVKSFLWKILKQIKQDDETTWKRLDFEKSLDSLVTEYVKDSWLNDFENSLTTHFQDILRKTKDDYIVDVWLPSYEDIFYKMMFSVKTDDYNLPIENHWDWYISMFIIAVLRTIAEKNTNWWALFLFEEPETFLHENHQEYFYNKVLCELAKNNQVIYTTHSKKMVDIFSPETIIRLYHNWFCTKKWNQLLKKFEPEMFMENQQQEIESSYELDKYINYSKYIKSIEPNLWKLVFSDKVILIEWPMDLMTYSQLLWHHFNDEHFLTYNNIAIVPHHWKDTSIILIQICNALWIDYFIIHDWDLDKNYYDIDLAVYSWLNDDVRKTMTKEEKQQLTKNFKIYELIKDKENFHFNKRNLESVLQMKVKNDLSLWTRINELKAENNEWNILPTNLLNFIKQQTK